MGWSRTPGDAGLAALVQELLHGTVRRGWLQQFHGGFACRQNSAAHFLPGHISMRRYFKPGMSTRNFFASSIPVTVMPSGRCALNMARLRLVPQVMVSCQIHSAPHWGDMVFAFPFRMVQTLIHMIHFLSLLLLTL
jgi:hypothetical protein